MSEDLGRIKVESFWGAIASFCLLQIFGYILLQIFINFIDMLKSDLAAVNLAVFIFGMVFLFIFLLFQSISFYKIKRFVTKYNMNTAIQSLSQKDELTKLSLIPIFLLILILINIGYCPFIQQEIDYIILVLFYIFSWLTSFVITILIKIKSPVYIAKGKNRIVGIFIGLFFFILGMGSKNLTPLEGDAQSFQAFAHILGIIGLGITIMLVCSLLMEDQIKQ